MIQQLHCQVRSKRTESRTVNRYLYIMVYRRSTIHNSQMEQPNVHEQMTNTHTHTHTHTYMHTRTHTPTYVYNGTYSDFKRKENLIQLQHGWTSKTLCSVK